MTSKHYSTKTPCSLQDRQQDSKAQLLTVYRLITQGTIEENIVRLHHEKGTWRTRVVLQIC